MTTIELHISDELAVKMRRLTENAETYIIDLLTTKVKELDNPKTLAEEYALASRENSVIISDFTHIDMEGWDNEY